jgi:hypothetical protein
MDISNASSVKRSKISSNPIGNSIVFYSSKKCSLLTIAKNEDLLFCADAFM